MQLLQTELHLPHFLVLLRHPSPHGKMKGSAALLALLLLVASFSQTSSGPVGSDLPICCFKFSRQELPRDRIWRHYSTGASCPLPAIVFVTTKGRQVCANPAASWVRRYLQSLEQN